jgi:phosphoribulokinase
MVHMIYIINEIILSKNDYISFNWPAFTSTHIRFVILITNLSSDFTDSQTI